MIERWWRDEEPFVNAQPLYEAAPAAPAPQRADEPVAFWRYRWTLNDSYRPDEIRPNTAPPIQIIGYSWPPEPLYTAAPAAPAYVPLSDEQVDKILDRERMRWATSPPTYEFPHAVCRAIESLVVAQPSVERSSADWRRLTGLWRFGVTVLPPACTDFYAWLDVLDAAIDERTNRMPQPPSDDMNKHLTRDNG
jgi:hypothetical protein